MKAIELISIDDLKNAVKELNASGLSPKRVKVVGISKHDLIKAFAFAMENVPEADLNTTKDLTLAKAMYMDIFRDEIEKEQKEAEKQKGKKKKEAPAKKEAPEKKVLRNMSKWGSSEGSQAYLIDEMLEKGGHTREEIARAVNTKTARVSAHMQHLKKKFNVVLVCNEGKYYVKEEKKSGSKKS